MVIHPIIQTSHPHSLSTLISTHPINTSSYLPSYPPPYQSLLSQEAIRFAYGPDFVRKHVPHRANFVSSNTVIGHGDGKGILHERVDGGVISEVDGAVVTMPNDRMLNHLNHSNQTNNSADNKLFLERRLAWVVGYDAMTIATAAAGAITHPYPLFRHYYTHPLLIGHQCTLLIIITNTPSEL